MKSTRKKAKQLVLLCIMCISMVLYGCSGKKDVKDKEITLEINGEEYSGKYTGQLEDDVPNGSGKFSMKEDDDYLIYSGKWKEGKFSGKGKLKTNIYIIDFSGTQTEGIYNGETLNGEASGDGSFEAVNSDKVKYKYSGEFKKGTFHGQGTTTYESDEYYTKTGTYQDGEFTPTPAEYFYTLGTLKDEEYEPTEKAMSFLKNNPNLFLDQDKKIDKKLIESNISYNKISKKVDDYGDKLISVDNLQVIQIREEEGWQYENTTFAILQDARGNVYFANMIGKAKHIYQGSIVSITALPLDYFTYKTVSDSDMWALSCAVVRMEK